jgi:hypothetical protein
MTSRGLRNNNPGNIDRNATRWQGMADDQSGDPRFVVFKTPQYGIRAIARLMLTYQNQYGLKTVRALINRWAPPVENNTSAYVAAVASGVGVGPDDPIDVDTTEVMLPLVKAIILHENGQNPYPDATILEGLHMAGIADAKPKPLAKQNTFQAQVGAGVAVVGAAGAQVSQYAPTVKGWADKLSDFTGSPIIQHAVTILLTVAGGLTLIGIASQILKQRSA